MYEFLDSGFKKRAFKKALKEVKNEGYYIDLSSGTLLKPSIDAASDIADLSNRTLANKYLQKEETYDVTGLSPNQEIQENKVEQEMAEYAMEEIQGSAKFEEQFSDSTFISGKDKQDEDMLSRQTVNEGFNLAKDIVTEEQTAEEETSEQDRINKEREEFRKRFIENIERKIAEREALEKAREVEQEETSAEPEPAEEIDSQPEPQVADEKEIPAKTEPAARPKRKYNKKKRRKYDADIVGGFGF